MFDFSELQMKQLVIHKVGNKLRDEGFFAAPDVYFLTDGNVEELLLKYFLSSFREKVVYKFFHETDLHLHELYNYITSVFIDQNDFYEQSTNILQYLYEKSNHPQIKGGEFYMAYFSGCKINEYTTDAIGIFKTETKENFLKVSTGKQGFSIDADKGINIRKLDKGCIIFNTESPDGYRIAVVDNSSKNNAEIAAYWKEDFLSLTDVQDEYFHTKNCLELCQDFAENIYGAVHQADKKDQVVFMNDAISYFAQNDQFQVDDFVETVVKEPELRQQFKEYKECYDINQGFQPTQEFCISNQAVKTAKRKFKNLIKLDTDIEIKVNQPVEEQAGTNFIERGFDEQKGMNFYKVYFNQEE